MSISFRIISEVEKAQDRGEKEVEKAEVRKRWKRQKVVVRKRWNGQNTEVRKRFINISPFLSLKVPVLQGSRRTVNICASDLYLCTHLSVFVLPDYKMKLSIPLVTSVVRNSRFGEEDADFDCFVTCSSSSCKLATLISCHNPLCLCLLPT